MTNKKKKNKKDDYIGFRTRTERDKKEFQDQSEQLKESKKLTKADLFKDGILANLDVDSEEAFLLKKNIKRNRLADALDEVRGYNEVIKAYNRRLKDLNPTRYKNLSVEDGTIKLYDQNGKKII